MFAASYLTKIEIKQTIHIKMLINFVKEKEYKWCQRSSYENANNDA